LFASGIGKELALKLAKEQMKIVIASTNQEKLDAAAKEIKEAGAIDVLPIVCDVSVRDSVVNLHQEITKKFGTVDLLVCNAGVTTSGPFDQHRPEDWEWVYDVVLHGPVYCIQLFYPDMIKQKSGHIVIVGSQAG
jgi:NADP-dependent 3-hydroxy acid dehydrogenase YdfG